MYAAHVHVFQFWDSILCTVFALGYFSQSSALFQAVENGRNLVALSCSIKLVNAIVSAEKRETPITDVSSIGLL